MINSRKIAGLQNNYVPKQAFGFIQIFGAAYSLSKSYSFMANHSSVPIAKISQIKDYRIFRDFSWPTDLPEFGQFNLIYGWNGTGKTALANIFRHFVTRNNFTEGTVEVLINNNTVSGSMLESAAELPQVRVFDRHFVDASVFEDHTPLGPIFYLGEESIEKQNEIAALKRNLDSTDERLSQAQGRQKADTKSLDEFCGAQARMIKELLTSSGGGPYNNYNKTDFRKKCEELSMCDASSKLLSEEKKSTSKQQKEDQPREPINAPTFNYPDISQATAAIEAQLATMVVSKVLDRLVKTPAVAEWVKQGLSLHVDRGGDVTCQFCGNLLSKECITDLEAHFNDQYETFLNDLATRQSSLEDAIRSIDKMSLPNPAQLYDYLRVPYEEAMRELANAHENLKNYLQGLTEAISHKHDKPFERMDLLPFIKGKKLSSDKAACDGLAHLNNVIDQHNQHTKNFQNIVDGARKQLEECLVAEVIPKFCEYTKSVSVADEQIRADSTQAEELRGKIIELERELVQHLKPANELNHDLQNFLGRGDLRLDVKDRLHDQSPRPTCVKPERRREDSYLFLVLLKIVAGQNIRPLSRGCSNR